MKNKTITRIYEMSKSHLKKIILVISISLMVTGLQLLNPYLVKILIDNYLSKGIYEIYGITVLMIAVIYILIVVLKNILNFYSTYLTEYIGEKIVYDLRNKLFKFIENANVSFHDKTSSGKLFVRLTSDIEDISALFKDVMTGATRDAITVIAIVIVIIFFNIKLSLIIFVLIPVIAIISYIITKKLNIKSTVSKAIRTRLNTFLAESIYGIKLIKIFNRQKEKEKEFRKISQEFFDSRKIIYIYHGLLPGLMVVLENLAISMILYAVTIKLFGIELEIGLVYIFITYIKNIFEPITRIVDNFETLQDSIVSINKIYEILDKKDYLENLEEGIKIEKSQGKIEFKNVWFSYDNKNYVLKDVSFTINAKESIALVGKTGSGKTTIINLINRFYEINKGEILIDGINIKDINLTSLRKNIGVILQDPFIYAKTIKENIKLNSNISDDKIEEAIRLSSAELFIDKYPERIEYMLTERGEQLSIGQKQLIAFARIFAHNPSIFVLDEATANIDTNTEKLIQKAVDTISKEKTSIFIAHRLSTIVNVDKILVLENGKIIETGSHSNLVEKGGYYSELYNSYYNSLAL